LNFLISGKLFLVIIAMIIVIGFLFGYVVGLRSQLSELSSREQLIKELGSWLEGNVSLYESRLSNLSSEKEMLESRMASLNSSLSHYESLVREMDSWLRGNTTLAESLRAERDSLRSWLQGNITMYENKLSALSSRIDILESEKKQLMSWLSGNISFYESRISDLSAELAILNLTLNEYVDAYSSLRDSVNNRWSGANASVFVTPDDPLVKELVLNITGGWTDKSSTAELLSDLKKLYDWVVDNIDYRYDGLYPVLPDKPMGNLSFVDEMWQMPSETLKLRMGDCEDMAILLASMIRAYGASAELIVIENETIGHMAVQVPLGKGEIIILDPAGRYYTGSETGALGPRDIREEINRWLSYWANAGFTNTNVTRIFSDKIDKRFSSTEEYIEWMYSRT
jgi:predicted  nucleic acid-binding Zn-ribbon protein